MMMGWGAGAAARTDEPQAPPRGVERDGFTTARQQTQRMLSWWETTGVDQVDLAVRRQCGAMIWHRDRSLDALPLAWARAENVRCGEVYVRPARGHSWPVVFMDDVAVATARRVARKYDAAVIETSPAGGCHVWLSCTRGLDEGARRRAQRWLAGLIGADPGSTSGEHLGRLAGFKNWKRSGCWVNVLEASRPGRRWSPQEEPDRRHRLADEPSATADVVAATGRDTSESGREWGWICGLIEAGYDPREVYERLVERARPRRDNDAERYARRTLARALDRLGRADRAKEVLLRS